MMQEEVRRSEAELLVCHLVTPGTEVRQVLRVSTHL